jgi:hypothetical protein
MRKRVKKIYHVKITSYYGTTLVVRVDISAHLKSNYVQYSKLALLINTTVFTLQYSTVDSDLYSLFVTTL